MHSLLAWLLYQFSAFNNLSDYSFSDLTGDDTISFILNLSNENRKLTQSANASHIPSKDHATSLSTAISYSYSYKNSVIAK